MVVGDETAFDAPVTPAPVFAYRALRAVFWGEDETPEQASKRTGNLSGIGHNTVLDLEPGQRRKRATLPVTSPAKSILRTPGLNTPRRVQLKDINVSFKDVRKSISPEITSKESLPQVKGRTYAEDEKENQVVTVAKSVATDKDKPVVLARSSSQAGRLSIKSANSSGSPQKRKVQESISMPTRPVSPQTKTTQNPVVETLSFDADAYMRNTEKEMKKLIKYGQKMKDYARRQDEENDKLRIMLDDLRKENERLKKQLEEPAYASQKPAKSESEGREKPVVETRSRKRAASPKQSIPEKDKPGARKVLTEIDLLDLDNHLSSKAQHDHTRPQAKRPHQDSSTGPNTQSNSHPAPGSSSPAKRPRHQPLHETSKKVPQPQTEQQQNHHLPLRPLTNAPSTNRLAPDRLAAARARVRKKAELRKASAGNEAEAETRADPPVDTGTNTRNSKIETSLVDWAGL